MLRYLLKTQSRLPRYSILRSMRRRTPCTAWYSRYHQTDLLSPQSPPSSWTCWSLSSESLPPAARCRLFVYFFLCCAVLSSQTQHASLLSKFQPAQPNSTPSIIPPPLGPWCGCTPGWMVHLFTLTYLSLTALRCTVLFPLSLSPASYHNPAIRPHYIHTYIVILSLLSFH